MKKIRILLAIVLLILLLTSVFILSEAEQRAEELWRADLTKLMDPADIPKTTEIKYDNPPIEGMQRETHDVACEITINGDGYGCEFTFDIDPAAEYDWSAVQQWLGGIVTDAARTAGSDSEALAKAIDKSIAAARKNAAADAEGVLPAWADEGMRVSLIRVSTPFYPELSEGKNGEATKRLQQRLIELGFLSGTADGYYGQQTKAAVEALESYVRELEQDLIDLRPEETPTPTPEPTPTPAPTIALQEGVHELTLVPRKAASAAPSALPTETPEPMDVVVDVVKPEPATRVDGIADALLQAYIYSDEYCPARRVLAREDSGSDVARVQRRLLNLGCFVDAADGTYGGNTVRSVRIFQAYNGLPQTGDADLETLKLLFSKQAKAPENPMLSLGSSGEAVKRMQTRLRELGFSNVGSDGDYGAATKTAVETLQSYLRNREKAYLQAQNPSITTEEMEAQLTIEVNGVADPLLLDAFYSSAFPAIPAELSNGSNCDDVVRVQRRLNGLEFFYGTLDGHYGGQTESAITAFQKRHKLPQTGVADSATLSVLFSGDAKKALKPYEIKVSTDKQRVYVYGLDNDNEYTVLVKEMKCSTGKNDTPTPKGTYQSTTGPGARWHYFKKFDCWAQYAYYIQGDIMFHSVLYGEKDGPVTRSSVNNLGKKASHGCVRLAVEDAKWIYENCPKCTKVTVY